MASFTNFATLIYNGGTSNSNTVTGELLETLTLTKTAASSRYTARDNVTYVLSLVNGGTTPLTELALTDDLGGYAFGTDTVYPLTYNEGTLRVYVNGVLQTTPTVTAGPPLTVTGLTVPAGGNALLVYEAAVTRYAPLDQEAAITNTATVTGAGHTGGGPAGGPHRQQGYLPCHRHRERTADLYLRPPELRQYRRHGRGQRDPDGYLRPGPHRPDGDV